MSEIHSLKEKVDQLLHELEVFQSDARDHRQEVDLEAQPFTKASCKPVQRRRDVENQLATYDIKLDSCSNRKRAPAYSFGHGVPSAQRGKKRSWAATAIEGAVRGEGQPGVRTSERADLCEACDATCWWGCECVCHQGCDDLTDDESYWRSPKRAASPQKAQEAAVKGRHMHQRDGPTRRLGEGIKGCRFSKAPRWGTELTRNMNTVELSQECHQQHINGHIAHEPQVIERQQDICMACDTTCWWGCECACHEGCDDLTDEGGSWQSPRRVGRPSYHGTAGLIKQALSLQRTAAASGTAVNKGEPLSTARARSFTFSRRPRWDKGRTGEGGAAAAVNSVPASGEEPTEIAAPGIMAQPGTPILHPTSKPAGTEGVKECAQDDMVLSTRLRAPAARFGRPSPCTSRDAARSRQRRILHPPTPGPGQYDPSTSQRPTNPGPVFATHDPATARHSVQHVLALKALQHRMLGPGTYDAAKVLSKLQKRDPSAVIMPQGKTTSRRPPDAPPETVAEAKTVSPKPYRPAAKDAKDHKSTQRRGHRSHRGSKRKEQAKRFDSKWASSSDDDDAKYASTSSTDSASWNDRQYSSADDSSSSAHETPSTEAKAKKVASASRSEVRPIRDSWSQVKGGVRMRPDTPAGVTWRNRIAMAKVREERERPSRLYAYEVRHTLTDPRVLGGAGFEAQEKARVKEEERRMKNPRLRKRQAMLIREREAQAEFVGPQLPHAWVQETRHNRRPTKADEAARALVEVGSARLKVVETITAYGASLQKNLKPVLRYGEPGPAPPTLARARAIREAEARARETWLGPQLHGELTKGPVVDIGKLPGRQVVVIEKKGQVQVTDFMEPPRATSDIGPGYYTQERPPLAGAGAPDFSKMVSRDEAFGPHGERPAEEDDERGMDCVEEQRGGDLLILEPDKAVVQKRVKSFSFARAGINVPVSEAKQGPAEGDVLDLDVCVEVGMERKGGKLVSFDRQHGRDERFYRHKPLDFVEDDDGAEGQGDMLELEVKREATESRSKSAAFSKTSRWAVPRHNDSEGQVLPLSPQHHVVKRNFGGGVSFARQAGRWDKEVDEEALNKQAMRDERDGARFELEAQLEASCAVERAHRGGLLSTRASAAPVLDMSKQRDRDGHGREGMREPSKDDKQMTEQALRLEAERADAMERAERTALSNKGKGGGSVINFSKARGRSTDRWEQVRMDAVREGGAAEGEVLVLEPSAKPTSRVKKSRDALDWSKLKSRFAEEKHDEVDERPQSPEARSQLPTRPAAKGVSFALQLGRPVDASNRAEIADEDSPEGQRLILDHTSTITSDDRRVTGGSFLGPGETTAAGSGVRRPSTQSKTMMHSSFQFDLRPQQELPVVSVMEQPPWKLAGAGDEGVQDAELRSLSPPVLRPIGVIEQALRYHGLTDDRAGSSSGTVASVVVSQGSIGQSVGAAEGREAGPDPVVADLLDDLWNLEI